MILLIILGIIWAFQIFFVLCMVNSITPDFENVFDSKKHFLYWLCVPVIPVVIGAIHLIYLLLKIAIISTYNNFKELK